MVVKLKTYSPLRLRAILLGDQTRMTLVLAHEQEPDDRVELVISGADAKDLDNWAKGIKKTLAVMDGAEPVVVDEALAMASHDDAPRPPDGQD